MTGYQFRTTAGCFYVMAQPNGWHAYFDGERFDGPFPNAQAAVEDVANGHSAWPSCGDPSRLRLSDDLSDWAPIRP